MVVVSMMEPSAGGEDASSAASANIPLVESSSTSSRSSWPYETTSANLPPPPASPSSTTAASSLSSIAASEAAAAAAAAIDIDNYFRGSNGFFPAPMQNSYHHGKPDIKIVVSAVKNKPFKGSRSPVRSPSAPFYPPLHSMWGFSAHGTSSNGGAASPNSVAATSGGNTNSASKEAASFGYPPTPPIDLKSSNDNQQHLQLSHHEYLHQHSVSRPSVFRSQKYVSNVYFHYSNKRLQI